MLSNKKFLSDRLLTQNGHGTEVLTLSGPGGGGLRDPDEKTHSCQSETSYSMMPKLGDF